MISEDRIHLNDRFCKAFSLLEDKGIIIKNDRGGKGIGDFAEKVLGNRAYGHIVRAFLNEESERVISYSQARTFCREYGINESWMLDGVGTPFGLDPKKVYESVDTDVTNGNILFTTVEAFAGSAVDVGGFATESSSFFSLPGIKGDGLVAFPVKGNSMEPVIQNGDILVCKQVDNLNQVNDNDIYAVKSSGSLWVKYVQKIKDSRAMITQLKLISANHLEYEPFVEEVNEYTRLYKVIRKISGF
ncbi:MAG: S24 family peptidase [Saprospiraceae bacterium]|nr:S24 family peptidase [Saprospiraceae bacterium]